MCFTDRPLGVFMKSVAAVVLINRRAVVVRGSAVVVVPMSRWAPEVRGSIVSVVSMNRWVLLSLDLYV